MIFGVKYHDITPQPMKGFTLKIALKILHFALCCRAAGEEQKRRGTASLTPLATPKKSKC